MLGLHLDLKWSMPKKTYLKRILIRAKQLGVDTILLEFENKIYIDWLKQAIHPDCWQKNDLRWFQGLCKELALTIIPKVPLLGHMEWVLQWPWWAHLRENNDFHEICPNHPETPEFVRKLLQTVLDLFPDSPIIHLGGDETRSLGSCVSCQSTGKSKADIYLDHYLPLIRMVESSGRRAMIYSDMILSHPQALNKLPRSVIIADWDYWSGAEDFARVWGQGLEGKNLIRKKDDFDKLPHSLQKFKKYFFEKDGCLVPFPYVRFLQEMGLDVVVFTAARCDGDNYCAPRTIWHIKNTIAGSRKAATANCLGTVITSWAVRFNHFETNWPAIFAGAYAYQNPKITITLEELSHLFARTFFKCDWPSCFFDLDLLSATLPDIQSAPHFDGIYADPYPPDIIHRYIEYIYRDPKSHHTRQAKKLLTQTKANYVKGYNILCRREKDIRKNQLAYSIWKLSAKTLVHKANVLPTIMDIAQGGSASANIRRKFLREVTSLTKDYDNIFGQTFKVASLAMEIALRFSEETELLHR